MKKNYLRFLAVIYMGVFGLPSTHTAVGQVEPVPNLKDMLMGSAVGVLLTGVVEAPLEVEDPSPWTLNPGAVGIFELIFHPEPGRGRFPRFGAKIYVFEDDSKAMRGLRTLTSLASMSPSLSDLQVGDRIYIGANYLVYRRGRFAVLITERSTITLREELPPSTLALAKSLDQFLRDLEN